MGKKFVTELTYVDFDGLSVKECIDIFMQFNKDAKIRWEIGDGKFTNDRLVIEPTFNKGFVSNKEDL